MNHGGISDDALSHLRAQLAFAQDASEVDSGWQKLAVNLIDTCSRCREIKLWINDELEHR